MLNKVEGKKEGKSGKQGLPEGKNESPSLGFFASLERRGKKGEIRSHSQGGRREDWYTPW